MFYDLKNPSETAHVQMNKNQKVPPTPLDLKTRSVSGPPSCQPDFSITTPCFAWDVPCILLILVLVPKGPCLFCRHWISAILDEINVVIPLLFVFLFFWVFLGSTEPPPPSHPAPYGWSDCQIFYSRLPLPWQPCTQLRETCLNQHAASDEAPAQRNCEACLMTGLKTLFLDTSGLTFHCHPWNLPKGPMLSLATDVSPMTLEYSFSLLSRAPNTLPQSVTPPSTCYSAKRHTHLVDAQFSFSLSMVGTNVFLLGRQSSFCRQTSACLPSVIGWVTAHIPFLPFQSWKRVTLFCK